MSELTKTHQPLTREEMLAHFAINAEEVQKQFPDSDLKISSGWWKPAVHLGADIKEQIDEETQQKLNSCVTKVFEQKYSPEAVAQAKAEGSRLLVGHPEILKQFEAIFSNTVSWDKMHAWAIEKEDEGNEGKTCFD